VAFSPSRVAAVRTRAGAKNPKAPRASADPGSADDWFAGCESQHQQTTFAKKKRHDVVFFVKQAPRASADPGSPRAAILSDFLRIAYNSTIEPDYASR
jgi:hypothetical protein